MAGNVKESTAMRWIVLFSLLSAPFLVGCPFTREKPQVPVKAQAAKGRVYGFIGMYTTDVPGESGAIFNQTVDRLLRQHLAPYLREAPRYMLRVISIDYATPQMTGRPSTYSLTLEAHLFDRDGKCSWTGSAKAEFVRSDARSEKEVQQVLAERVCQDLANSVPAGESVLQEKP